MMPGDLQRQTVVIADDEELGRILLTQAVSAAGHEPVVFDNGLDALAAASIPGVSLVLLDVDMPGMNGLAVCRALRTMPHMQFVPIIIVTGHDDSAAINSAYDAGATDFITKPVNWALLPHRLTYVMRGANVVRALEDRETKVRTLLAAMPDALWVVAADGEVKWNPETRAEKMTGNWGAPVGVVGDIKAAIAATARDQQPRNLSWQLHGASGEVRSFEMRLNGLDENNVLVVRQDTSERTKAAENIKRLAYYDSLTGLPNRQQCIEHMQGMLAAAGDHDVVSLIFADLNGFKRINDTFGHSMGDRVLTTAAERLRAALESSKSEYGAAFLARFGGDEFVIITSDDRQRTRALELAKRCRDALSAPINYGRLEFLAVPSIGLASYPENGRDTETLLKNADTAMYHAKANAEAGIAVYAPAMSSRLRDWLDLESRLRKAIRGEQLTLAYQPKYYVKDGALAGVEALVRWCDEHFGNIPPSRFISMAEETGLIVELGAWVTRTACQQIREWVDRGLPVRVAINLSGKEILHGDAASVLEREIKAARIPGHLLEIEITESVLVTDSDKVKNTLDRIRKLGCRIALDDFGTGYSSLSYITNFPPDVIKIDRSFVANIDRTRSEAAVANAILSLAHSLGIEVTAEGVERTSQLEWLRAHGCHQAQGFLLSRPMPKAEIERTVLWPTVVGAEVPLALGQAS